MYNICNFLSLASANAQPCKKRRQHFTRSRPLKPDDYAVLGSRLQRKRQQSRTSMRPTFGSDEALDVG